jgi:aminomethyltransferase
VGEVTSGTFSPTLQKPIAMAYVQPEHAGVGTELAVDIRGTLEPARVVKLPFYSRS